MTTLALAARRPHLGGLLILLLCSSQLISSIRRASDNDSPVAAYLVTVRRPDGLLGAFDEPDALEQWHTYLLGQVCDPATAERFPTAESRLIYSYSHVVSGFSAWLTRQEVADMATRPWFVEAIPDKAYKLMSVGGDEIMPWLDGVKGNMGEGITIGVLDVAARIPVISPGAGMPSPPAKWKGRCDDNDSEACNNKLIGLRTFVGEVEQPTTFPGLDYDKAFAVAPMAHLAIYRVCKNMECPPTAVSAGMAAAVDDGVDVIVISAVSVAASYAAVARGVLVCAPGGSSSPDMRMLEAESVAPWLLTIAASGDTDRRVLTNVQLGSGILKPDVSADLPDAQMAAAHVSAVAALVKKAHRGWSPAAIKSALVTTADPAGPAGDALPGEGATASYFVTGAGEVNPARAMDPGLVYDLAAGDLCGVGLGDDAMDLNYPSIMIAMGDQVQQVEARRTVTNVEDPAPEEKVYRVEVTALKDVVVAVNPSTMAFSDAGQKRDFVVTVRRLPNTPAKALIEGELRWVSEKHVVRSPMVVVVGETTAAAASSAAGYYGAADAASIQS